VRNGRIILQMGLRYKNLDAKTREFMLEELELDVKNGRVYVSRGHRGTRRRLAGRPVKGRGIHKRVRVQEIEERKGEIGEGS